MASMRVLVMGLVWLAGCMLTNAVQAQDRIRLGILPFSEALGAVIADREGYFKAEGIEVEMSKFNSGALSLPLLQAGKLDIALSNTVSTLQALEQGLQGVILAPAAITRASGEDSTTAVMVLKGAIKSPKDLEGKRIAVNVINSSAWLNLVAYLDVHHVDRSKVRMLEVPFPQMNDPLLNGQIDAIAQVEPFRTVLLDSGKVEVLGYSYVEAQPNADITQYLSTRAWVSKNPQVAVRFARAITRANEYLQGNEAAVREANQQFTNLNPALKDRVLLPRFGTAVNMAQIERTMELMIKYGLLKQPVDLANRTLAQR